MADVSIEATPDVEIPSDEIPEAVPGTSRVIEANGVQLHVVEAGPEDGKLLVLLHGFPEFWYGWHETIGPLANAGYRVVVPDQRGYNLSEKPPGVADYRIDELARDVLGLIDAYGRDRAAIAGHDWGAAVGWWLSRREPAVKSTADAVDATGQSGQSTDDAAVPTLRQLWRRLASWVLPGTWQTRTPAEVSRAAVERGLPRGPVETLTEAFRDVEYGGQSEEGRQTRARTAFDTLEDARESETDGEER